MTSNVPNPLTLMLARFLESDSQTSMLIHGPWGIGKTHSLEGFLREYNFGSADKYVARSTVSVFGKTTLADIQAAIFPSAQQIASDEVAKARLGGTATAYLSLGRFLGGENLNKNVGFIARKLGQVDVPWIGRLDALALRGNYEMVNDFVIVLDDLERHSAGVSLKDLFGLVSELASQRHSKVIVICNEDALEKLELDLLNQFREKIFDVEIGFRRSPRDVARIGMDESASYAAEAIKIFEALGVTNIRVVKRFSYFVQQFWLELCAADERVIREVLEHAALLTWARYDPTVSIPRENFASLVSQDHWFDAAVGEGDREKSSWEVAWDAAASILQFSSQSYDALFIDYLLTGMWVPGSLVQHIELKTNDLKRIEAEACLKEAWRVYGDSLNPDQTDVVSAFSEVFDEYLEFLRPRDIDAAFSLLEDLGVDISATRDRYVELARDDVLAATVADWPYGGLKSKALAGLQVAARINAVGSPTIDSALTRMAIDRSWSEEDVALLASCSEEDLLEWMSSNPDNMVTKIRQGLLAFRSMRSEDVRYEEIGKKAERLLKHLATLSELNRVRVENLYKLSPETGAGL